MDSRLKTSGMTEGGLKASGMTEGLLGLFVMPAGLFVIPPVLFVIPAGPPLSCPPAPSVIPAGSLCHARRPPLSFPPVVSGNPGSCFVVLLFVWALHGGSHGFPIKRRE